MLTGFDLSMRKLFTQIANRFPWFVDAWYYIVMVLLFIILALIFL